MIMDNQSKFSDEQAVTATAASENVLDLGTTRDMGRGTPIDLLCQVVEDFATLTSLTVSVEVDDNSSFSSAKTIATSEAVVVADLVAGKKFSIQNVPVGTEQYMRLKYTVAGSDATAGKVTAGIVFDVHNGHEVV